MTYSIYFYENIYFRLEIQLEIFIILTGFLSWDLLGGLTTI